MKTRVTFKLDFEKRNLQGEAIGSINRVAMGLLFSLSRHGFQYHNMAYVLDAISGRAKPNI